MEKHHQPTSENPNQGVLSNSEEQGPCPTTTAAATTQPQTRLYECCFCKKGFSNAQALGGHMNIHRKDKAKLKQASRENQRLMDSQAKMNPLTPSISSGNIHNNNINKPLEFTTGQVIIKSSTTSTSIITDIMTNKWLPSTFPPHHQDQELSYENHVALAEFKQLPLFVETASRAAVASAVSDNINYSNTINHHHHHHMGHAQANWQEDHQFHVSTATQGMFGAELDLELRLGHEPPKPTVDLGTRKFF